MRNLGEIRKIEFFFLKLSKTAGIVQILIYFRLSGSVIAKGRAFSTPPEYP